MPDTSATTETATSGHTPPHTAAAIIRQLQQQCADTLQQLRTEEAALDPTKFNTEKRRTWLRGQQHGIQQATNWLHEIHQQLPDSS